MIDKPGLKGRVKEFTNYQMSMKNIDNDSILRDTFFITTTKFNKKGKVIEFSSLYTHSNSTYKGINIYDSNNRIIKEIGYYDDNEIIVDYFYKDTILQKICSKSEMDDEINEMNENYFYSDKGKLLKRITSNIFIKNNDTVSLSNWIYKYDSNERPYESETVMNNVRDSMKKTLNKFEYNDLGLQIKALEYNENDSLINTDIYKYKFDKKGSWIEKKNYKNDTLKYLTTRIIEYE
jgi:hypothetical protein